MFQSAVEDNSCRYFVAVGVLQYVAVCGGVVLCVSVRGSVLQGVVQDGSCR